MIYREKNDCYRLETESASVPSCVWLQYFTTGVALWPPASWFSLKSSIIFPCIRFGTLANANKVRDWRIYADLAHNLIPVARNLYQNEDFGIELDQTVYALDATTIDLCLSLFPWAEFRQTKSAIKLHTLLDLRGSIPTFIYISDGKEQEVTVLDDLPLEAGAIYVKDRGYLDFFRLYRMTKAHAFFVIRAKKNMAFRRLYSAPVNRESGLLCDQTIKLTGY